MSWNVHEINNTEISKEVGLPATNHSYHPGKFYIWIFWANERNEHTKSQDAGKSTANCWQLH